MTPFQSSITAIAILFLAQGPIVSQSSSSIASGQTGFPLSKGRVASEAPSSYCGLYCVFAAAQVLDVDFRFEDIISAEYLTGRFGSTEANLVAALNRFGLDGSFQTFITIDQLRAINQPVILHVRPPSVGAHYSHWMLFLGFDGDEIKIYDPPRDNGRLTPAELLSIWDGTGIVVFEEGTTSLWAAIPIFGAAVPLMVIAIVLIWLQTRSGKNVRSIIVVSLIICGVSHTLFSSGFSYSKDAIRSVQASFFKEAVPLLDLKDVERMMKNQDCVLVDARRSEAYQQFHLPGAVNIPINSGYVRLKHGIEKLRGFRNVVFYCQSEHCSWAAALGSQVSARGVENVYVYSGGVNEWREKKHND